MVSCGLAKQSPGCIISHVQVWLQSSYLYISVLYGALRYLVQNLVLFYTYGCKVCIWIHVQVIRKMLFDNIHFG